MEQIIRFQKPSFQSKYPVRIMLGFILAYLLLHAYMYFHYAFQMMVFPFDFDVGEGLSLQRAWALSQGKSIYASVYQEPYTVVNYPPLFELLLAGLVRVFGPKLMLGRFISIFSTIICGYCISYIVYMGSRKKMVSALAGLFFFSSGWLKNWSVLSRHDTLALAFTIVGLCLFLNDNKCGRSKYLYLCALFFVGAIFTRQSAVAAPVSCFLFLVLQHFKPMYCYAQGGERQQASGSLKKAFHFLFTLIGMGFVLAAALSIITKGGFLVHVTKYTAGAVSWTGYLTWIQHFLQAHGIAVFLSLMYVVFLLMKKQVSVFSLFWMLSLVVTIAAGKSGSAINYFLEFWMANCILAGMAMSVVLDGNLRKKRSLALTYFVIICVILQLYIFYQKSDMTTPSNQDRLSGEKVAQLIRHTSGDILSEYTGYMAQNGKEIIFQPFSMTQLTKKGMWNQERIISSIRSKRFGLIVISKVGVDVGRWTEEVMDSVKANYRHLDTAKCFELSYFFHSESQLDIFVPEEVQE
ncbi:MAG: glycosyltransferase family 39 protein [Candidatus Omnitrophica bacterium]|nr:glycosyltransferase family 39 protein [Candidatus Omnitrophota bacterium]